MRLNLQHALRYCYLIALLVFGTHSLVYGQINTTGVYISPQLTYMTLKGDFNGNSGYAGVGEAAGNYIFIPEVDDTVGYGLVFGSRLNEFALELGLLHSEHDASFLGAKTTANYRIVNIDFKHFYRQGKMVQPYAGIGFGYHSLKVKDGAATNSESGEAHLHAWGINLPFGVVSHLSSNITLNAGIVLRLVEFGSMKTLNGEMQSQGAEVDGSGYYLNTGLSYKF